MIAGAIVMRITGWNWVDSVIAVAIGLWVLPRTWVLFKDTLNILQEGVPEGIDIAAVRQSLLGLPGVLGVHDLHVWAVTSGRPNLTVHLVHDPDVAAPTELLERARKVLAAEHHITHTTVQLETQPCAQAGVAVGPGGSGDEAPTTDVSGRRRADHTPVPSTEGQSNELRSTQIARRSLGWHGAADHRLHDQTPVPGQRRWDVLLPHRQELPPQTDLHARSRSLRASRVAGSRFRWIGRSPHGLSRAQALG